jgi:hypothetical protein
VTTDLPPYLPLGEAAATLAAEGLAPGEIERQIETQLRRGLVLDQPEGATRDRLLITYAELGEVRARIRSNMWAGRDLRPQHHPTELLAYAALGMFIEHLYRSLQRAHLTTGQVTIQSSQIAHSHDTEIEIAVHPYIGDTRAAPQDAQRLADALDGQVTGSRIVGGPHGDPADQIVSIRGSHVGRAWLVDAYVTTQEREN